MEEQRNVENVEAVGKDDRIVLVSGRFDPPHIGHWCSICRLAKYFKEVKVVILNDDHRRFPATYAYQVFEELLEHSDSAMNISLILNPNHFGFITLQQLQQLQPFDVYASGNLNVIRHIESLKVNTLYIDRAYHYAASNDVLPEG